MTFLPERTICAQRDFVSGVLLQPPNLVPVEHEVHFPQMALGSLANMEVPSLYGITMDKEGNIWFTVIGRSERDGKIGNVDAKTGKVTQWSVTTHGYPRRIEVDSSGIVWFGEYRDGYIGRFDPKTETFKEYQLPGPQPTPYALAVDKNGGIWYASMYQDVMGHLDPKTGQVIEYPFPHSEGLMREFFFDSQGRIWFAPPTNNKVGYF